MGAFKEILIDHCLICIVVMMAILRHFNKADLLTPQCELWREREMSFTDVCGSLFHLYQTTSLKLLYGRNSNLCEVEGLNKPINAN